MRSREKVACFRGLALIAPELGEAQSSAQLKRQTAHEDPDQARIAARDKTRIVVGQYAP
jgi:hypothetical protein